MEDKRSTYIIDWIIKNNGAEPPEEMQEEARKAFIVADAAFDDCAAKGAFSALVAACAADAAFAAFAAADAAPHAVFSTADAAAYADLTNLTDPAGGNNARRKNQQQTADICREHLPLEVWEN
jgi:3-keto-L-gulonate-6-phosphate decarboxylase